MCPPLRGLRVKLVTLPSATDDPTQLFAELQSLSGWLRL